MTDSQNNIINDLFLKLEETTKFSNHLNLQSLYSNNPLISREQYGKIYEEELHSITIIIKKLVRAFLRFGEVSELLDHIEAGTFPPHCIKSVFGRA